MPKAKLLARLAAATGALTLLGGCDMVVMNPMGDIALQQRDLVIIATVLMLLIVVPVIALVAIIAWRYRESANAHYEPDWDHSTQLELVIWSAPLLIIICLGAITWTSTHLLDPYRPLDRISAGKPVAPGTKPLEVQVVSLDWKWLFIYPEYGIATVNELAAPVDRPIAFRLTSSSVMNAFYVPTLAGMIYTMPSMETRLHAVINKAGDYDGFSANYSGAGFSGMRFRFHGLSDADFAAWVAKARAAGGQLDRARYLELEKPSEKVPPMFFGSVDAGLFDAVTNQCVKPGTPCMSDLMKKDAGHAAGMEHMQGMDMPMPEQPKAPLTSGSAGGQPPAKPADVQQRTPDAVADPAAQHHHNAN